jgi:hypothetical protein
MRVRGRRNIILGLENLYKKIALSSAVLPFPDTTKISLAVLEIRHVFTPSP